MEAKEFMIGDIIQAVVFTTDDDDNEVVYRVPARVEAVDANGMLGIDGKDSVLVEYLVENEMDYYETFDDIEPIILTEEMLMLNGFEKYPWNNSAVQFVFLDEEALIHYGSGIFCYKENTNIKIKYVHELQHLLRLCGLNDLADNFKIE